LVNRYQNYSTLSISRRPRQSRLSADLCAIYHDGLCATTTRRPAGPPLKTLRSASATLARSRNISTYCCSKSRSWLYCFSSADFKTLAVIRQPIPLGQRRLCELGLKPLSKSEHFSAGTSCFRFDQPTHSLVRDVWLSADGQTILALKPQLDQTHEISDPELVCGFAAFVRHTGPLGEVVPIRCNFRSGTFGQAAAR
jgi:hypothetical protein